MPTCWACWLPAHSLEALAASCWDCACRDATRCSVLLPKSWAEARSDWAVPFTMSTCIAAARIWGIVEDSMMGYNTSGQQNHPVSQWCTQCAYLPIYTDHANVNMCSTTNGTTSRWWTMMLISLIMHLKKKVGSPAIYILNQMAFIDHPGLVSQLPQSWPYCE